MPRLTTDLLKRASPLPGNALNSATTTSPVLFSVSPKRVSALGLSAIGTPPASTAGKISVRSPPSACPKLARRPVRRRARVAGGIDPVAEVRAARAEERRRRLHTLSGLADAYFIAVVEGTHRGGTVAKPKRPGTIAEERRIFERLVKPKFGDRAVAGMVRAEIRDFVTRQGKAAKSNARHCRNIIRQLMAYAVREGVIEHSPALDIAVPLPQPKTRVLSDREFRAFWHACEGPAAVEV